LPKSDLQEITLKVIRGKKLPLIAASHEDKNNPGVFKQVLLDSFSIPGGKVQMLNWATLPKGSSFKAHYHERMHEIFIIVSGSALMTVNKAEFKLETKDLILVPARSTHKMKNTADIDCQYIVFGILSGKGGKTINVSN